MVGRFRRTFSLNNLIETAKKSRVRRGRQVQVYSVIGQFHRLVWVWYGVGMVCGVGWCVVC